MSIINKKTIFLLIFTVLILAGCSTSLKDYVGARTDNYWNLRGGTYIETAVNAGYNILVNGTNKYLNFGSTSGTTGYGIRDNGGTMEFKANGGSWAAISSSASFTGTLNDISDVATTSTSYGDLLMWSGTAWTNKATSTLGITASAGGSATQVQINDYGSLGGDANFTYATTTDTLTVVNASTTLFTSTGAYLGTVRSGTWNGTALTDAYVDDTITASNYLSLATWFATTSAPQITTLSNLVSIGTIATGVWNGTAIGVTKGGTGLTTIADGSLLYASAANTLSALASSTKGYYLGINSSTGRPEWQAVSNIASSTDPTMSTTANIAINTTAASSSIRFYDGTAERGLYADKDINYTISSSTLSGFAGVTATSTIPLGFGSNHGETWISMTCSADTATVIDFGDGTNFMNSFSCGTATSTITFSANNTFTMNESRFMRVKSTATTFDWLTLKIVKRVDAD